MISSGIRSVLCRPISQGCHPTWRNSLVFHQPFRLTRYPHTSIRPTTHQLQRISHHLTPSESSINLSKQNDGATPTFAHDAGFVESNPQKPAKSANPRSTSIPGTSPSFDHKRIAAARGSKAAASTGTRQTPSLNESRGSLKSAIRRNLWAISTLLRGRFSIFAPGEPQ